VSKSAFSKYLASIQAKIGMHIISIEHIQRNIDSLRTRVEAGINVQDSQAKLDENETELVKTRSKIDRLKNFFIVHERRSKCKDRVIGFVVWAPPLVSVLLLTATRATSVSLSCTRTSQEHDWQRFEPWCDAGLFSLNALIWNVPLSLFQVLSWPLGS
jgi:hypothetical protein